MQEIVNPMYAIEGGNTFLARNNRVAHNGRFVIDDSEDYICNYRRLIRMGKINAEVCRDCGQGTTSLCKCKEFRNRITELEKLLDLVWGLCDESVWIEAGISFDEIKRVEKALKEVDKE
jgi:hypothetical protein